MEKVAIVGGVRTPFVKAASVFKDYSLQDLGAVVLRAVVERYGLKGNQIDEFVFGTVLLDPRTPNWAREILYAAGLSKNIYAHSVSNNCISGLVAMGCVAERIALGKIKLGIAGGVEAMSNPPIMFGLKASRKFLDLTRARSFGGKTGACCKIKIERFYARSSRSSGTFYRTDDGSAHGNYSQGMEDRQKNSRRDSL